MTSKILNITTKNQNNSFGSTTLDTKPNGRDNSKPDNFVLDQQKRKIFLMHPKNFWD